MSLSWNLPQPCIPLLYPTYYYYQWLCSLHNLSCQHPAFQLAPLTLSLGCQQFPSPTALDWKIMVHPFNHLSEFTLSYLTPLSSTQVKSNSPLDYIEPDQLNIVGENTHPCWLSHLKFMTGSQPQEGEAILLSFLLPFPSPFTLSYTSSSYASKTSFPSSLSAADASFFSKKINAARRAFPHLPSKVLLAPTCPCSICAFLCSPEWTLCVEPIPPH